jgi:hypothetical protein
MVVYVTYRVPVEVELEIVTGLVLLRSFLQTNRAKLDAPRRTHKTRSEALRPKRRRSQNPCYTLKRNSVTSPSTNS